MGRKRSCDARLPRPAAGAEASEARALLQELGAIVAEAARGKCRAAARYDLARSIITPTVRARGRAPLRAWWSSPSAGLAAIPLTSTRGSMACVVTVRRALLPRAIWRGAGPIRLPQPRSRRATARLPALALLAPSNWIGSRAMGGSLDACQWPRCVARCRGALSREPYSLLPKSPARRRNGYLLAAPLPFADIETHFGDRIESRDEVTSMRPARCTSSAALLSDAGEQPPPAYRLPAWPRSLPRVLPTRVLNVSPGRRR